MSVIRIEDVKAKADALARRIDAYADSAEEARDDATRKEKYQALKTTGTALTVTKQPPVPAKPAKKVKPADTRIQTLNSLTAALEKVRDLGKARDWQELQKTRSREPEPTETDSKGVIMRNGAAYYKNIVVRPGGAYHPKGTFGGARLHQTFICKSVEWQKGGNRKSGWGDRVIAVGDLQVETAKGYIPVIDIPVGQGYGTSKNRKYFITELAASDFFS
jgi:hypothetical protein